MLKDYEHYEMYAQHRILKDLMDALIFEDIGGIVSQSQLMKRGQQLYLRYEKKGITLHIPVYRSGLNMFRFNGKVVECIEGDCCYPLQAVALWKRFVAMNADIAKHWEYRRFTKGLETAIEQLTQQCQHFKASNNLWRYSEQLASLKDRPFHPLAKEKRGLSAADYRFYQSEYHRSIAVKAVAVKKSHVRWSVAATEAEYEDFWGDDLAQHQQALHALGFDDSAYFVFPVHPWQYTHTIPKQFASEIDRGIVVMLDTTCGEYISSSSMRTLISLTQPLMHLKVPFSMQSLGALRLTPPRYMKNGEAGETLLRALIHREPLLKGRLQLCDETVWWSYMNEEQDIFQDQSGHLTMQFRYYPETLVDAQATVSMASLAAHDKVLYQSILGTAQPTKQQIIQLFEQLTAEFFMLSLTLMKYGVLPEIHGQNVLITFKNFQIDTFILRDHDTVRLYPTWLKRHAITPPNYTIRKDTPNTLLNEDVESFFAYFQTLAVSVNLYAIVDALVHVFNVSETTLMNVLMQQMKEAIRTVDWLPGQRKVVEQILFQQTTWPFKRILLPLLQQRGDGGGSMPSSLGRVPNPLKVTDDDSARLAT